MFTVAVAPTDDCQAMLDFLPVGPTLHKPRDLRIPVFQHEAYSQGWARISRRLRASHRVEDDGEAHGF